MSPNFAAPLAPLSIGPLGVFEGWTRHQTPFTVKLREKKLSITGDDYVITTPNDQPFLRLKGKVWSLHSRKFLYDANGNLILTIKNKIISLFRHFYLYAGDSDDGRQPVVDVQGNFQIIGSKMTITFQNAVGSYREPVVLELKGKFLDRNAEITWNGQPVARVERNFLNLGQILFDNQTYYLTVAPGVDIAMMAAICVCMDEKNSDKD